MGRTLLPTRWGMALLSLLLTVIPGSINLAITLLPFLMIAGMQPRLRQHPGRNRGRTNQQQ